MASELSTEEDDLNDLFQEPEGYYQDEKAPTFDLYTLRSGQRVKLRLIGHSPLWVRSL